MTTFLYWIQSFIECDLRAYKTRMQKSFSVVVSECGFVEVPEAKIIVVMLNKSIDIHDRYADIEFGSLSGR